METRDWSLVFFTVLTQAAVGAFLVLQVLRYLSGRRHPGHGGGTPVPTLAVLAVLSVGLLAALFHLSDPLQAARAVVNFSTSWLSREIVFGSLFAVLLGGLAWAERRGPEAAPPSRALTAWLPWMAGAAGVTFLGCQIAIYLLPAQPSWNSFATPAAFGGTALRLGVLGVAAGLVGRRLAPEADDPAAASSAVLPGLALAGILAVTLEFVAVPLHLAALASEPSAAAAASAQRLTGDYGGVLLLRLGLLAAAAAALGGVFALARRPLPPSRHRLAAALASGALGLVLVSEVCGRFLFYAMRVRVGI